MSIRSRLKSFKTRRFCCNVQEEILWAEVFRSSTAGSDWLGNLSLSPGRWAVGYPYLYVLFRMLDEWKPCEILDIGLGQSTRMIARYARCNPSVRHTVVEHDEGWITFFRAANQLPQNVEVRGCRLRSVASPAFQKRTSRCGNTATLFRR